MKNFICIFILVAPSVSWKLWKDRNGVTHPAIKEAEMVVFIMLIDSILMGLFKMAGYTQSDAMTVYFIWISKSFLVCLTGFGLFFNPLINFIRFKYYGNGIKGYKPKGFYWSDFIYCMDHLSPTAIPDKYYWWRSLGWAGRLIVYVSCFTTAIVWFVL